MVRQREGSLQAAEVVRIDHLALAGLKLLGPCRKDLAALVVHQLQMASLLVLLGIRKCGVVNHHLVIRRAKLRQDSVRLKSH